MKRKFILIITFLILQVTYSQNSIEVTYKRNDNNTVQFFYKKNVPGSYYLTIDFTILENSNDYQIFERVIKNKSGYLFTLKPINEKKGISFSYGIKYSFGNPKPKINNNTTYLLPFKRNKNVKIIEASNLGEKYFGSEKPIDWKSFIIFSKEPDTVYSMRKGKVVRLIKKYDKDVEFNKIYTSKRNIVLIEHEDGTFATYKGFNKNQIFVKLGQDVYPHTPLGILEKFNKNNHRLDFNIFHYLPDLIDKEKSTLKNRISKIKYINPNFFVDNENKKINSGEFHIVSFKEEIKLKEFSRKEKKKYKNNPNDFK